MKEKELDKSVQMNWVVLCDMVLYVWRGDIQVDTHIFDIGVLFVEF